MVVVEEEEKEEKEEEEEEQEEDEEDEQHEDEEEEKEENEDEQRENWTRSRSSYRRAEWVFGRTLHNAILSVRKNIIWNLKVKPPVDRVTFHRLMLCYNFEPFQTHWTRRQENGEAIHERHKLLLRSFQQM